MGVLLCRKTCDPFLIISTERIQSSDFAVCQRVFGFNINCPVFIGESVTSYARFDLMCRQGGSH